MKKNRQKTFQRSLRLDGLLVIMSKSKSFFVIIAVIFEIITSCKSSTEPKLEFPNTLWKLESFDYQGSITKPPNSQIYTIKFNPDGTANGKCNCNDFYVRYIIMRENNSLFLDQFVITEKECGCDRSISDKFVQWLRELKSYEIEKGKLLLYSKNNAKLIFQGEL
ncbi:META domain-containing protein [bacterium]|nr:META domain-containing protein [bacterium]